MPKIPTIIADGDLKAGPTSPYANGQAFSGGAAGMADLGQGLVNAASAMAQIDQKRKADDEYKWLQDSIHQYNMSATEFMEADANKSREDFATVTQEYLTKQRQEYLKAAPSARAKARLSALIDDQVERRRQVALNVTERTKINNSIIAIDDNLRDAMIAFRQDAGTSPDYAAGNLEPARALMHEAAAERFGADSVTARKLGESIDVQIVKGTAAHNPAYARKVMDESRLIDEGTRATLLNHIEQAEAGNRSLVMAQISYELEERLKIGRRRGEPVEMPAKEIFGLFPQPEVAQFKYQKAVEAHNEGVKVYGKLKDKVAGHQNQRLHELAATNIDGVENADPIIKRNQALQVDDPALWQRQNNSNVFNAFEKAGSDPNGLAAAYDVALQYQGPAPQGATPEEAARYLNLAQPHLMTVGEAERRADMLREGTPEQRLKTLEQMEAEFVNPDHWAIVYNDLVTLPKNGRGIPEGMQLAFLIDDPRTRKEFLTALDNKDELRKLNEEDWKKFTQALDGNDMWEAFSRAMIGEGTGAQAARKIQKYKDAITTYAAALTFGGPDSDGRRSASEAVKLSVERVLQNQMWHTKVNGQVLMIPKKREMREFGPHQALPPRTEAEIADIGRKLALTLRELADRYAGEIQLTDRYGQAHFPTLPPLPEGSPEVTKRLQQIITGQGYFVSTVDGQGATVYVADGNGNNFRLLDKQGRPFEVRYDALPEYLLPSVPIPEGQRMWLPTNPGMVFGGRLQPSRTYSRPGMMTNDVFFRQLQKPGYSAPPGPTQAIQP